jgi:hypothetical protein
MPFSLRLLEFKHDKYPGTDIPKNFSSRVRLQRPDTGEDREVLIFMNNPLRYAGSRFIRPASIPMTAAVSCRLSIIPAGSPLTSHAGSWALACSSNFSCT